MSKKIDIIGGGTSSYIRPHLALSAPAYGTTARKIFDLCATRMPEHSRHLHLTRMAGGMNIKTNDDLSQLIDKIVDDSSSHIVFMSAAVVDFEANILVNGEETQSGRDKKRLQTSDGKQIAVLYPTQKLLSRFRRTRKDLFLVGFKTTTGATEDEQFIAGLELLKKSSCNLVLSNDVHTRKNMIITPEQARYCVTDDRERVLTDLVKMTHARSSLQFTRSEVIDGSPVSWDSELIPDSLRTVVNYCIEKGAYKPFLGSTVGHFAVKIDDGKFLTSMRKKDLNKLSQTGMVLVEANGDDRVVAHGYKPSVGGQSQRIIFTEHQDVDCIVHLHCPLRNGSDVPVRTQWPYECGSHECGKNTSMGLKDFNGIKAVMLEKHGPNIVFNRHEDPQKVIAFIESNFDLKNATDEIQRDVAPN